MKVVFDFHHCSVFPENLVTRAVTTRGICDMWSRVNHVAIVVENVGKSLGFYTHVVGMCQIQRPNFDR